MTAALEPTVSTEWDDDGNVIGYGVTLRETPHTFEVSGRRLCTWCVFDALFFPALIDQTVHVASHCAATSVPVALTVTPTMIEDVAPTDSAVSLILRQNTPDIRAALCCYVHFLASDTVGRDCASTHARASIVNVHDAFAVDRERAERLLRATRLQNAGARTVHDPTAPGLSHRARWRTWFWGALAALTCPCHLPILLLMLSSTAAGALVSQRIGVAVAVLVALFVLFLTRALRTFRLPG